jgi:hypothetical protein
LTDGFEADAGALALPPAPECASARRAATASSKASSDASASDAVLATSSCGGKSVQLY